MFSHWYDRTIQTFNGPRIERVEDYAYSRGVEGVTSAEISVQEHLKVLALATRYVDSAVSKTCNVGDEVGYEEFKDVYIEAWKMECKGITTFRASGKRFGILQTVEEEEKSECSTEETQEKGREKEVEQDGSEGPTACFINLQTGQRECS